MPGRRMRPEDLLRLRWPGEVAISPDGRTVAYVETRVDPRANAYRSRIMGVRPGEAPFPLTGGERDGGPRWSPDGRWLGFVSKRGPFSQVWLLPAAGGEARPVTSLRGGVTEFAWSPDGRRIAAIARLDGRGVLHAGEDSAEDDDAVPAEADGRQTAADGTAVGGLEGDEADLERLYRKHNRDVKITDELFYKLDGEGYFTGRRGHLVVVDVERALGLEGDLTPAARQCTSGPYDHHEPVWAPDGRSVYVTSRRGPDYDEHPWRSSVYRVDLESGEVTEVAGGGGRNAAAAAVRPDGGELAFISDRWDAVGYDNPAVWLSPLDGGAPRPAAPSLDRPATLTLVTDVIGHGFTGLRYTPDGRAVIALVSDRGQSYLVRIDRQSGAVDRLVHGDRCVYAYDLDAQGRFAALAVATPTEPGDVYLVDLSTGEERRLTEVNAALFAEVEVARPERFTAVSPDGTQVEGWIVRPYGWREGERYPAALEVHGGPMMMYGQAFFHEAQVLSAAGYAVVYGNPRGSQGYGETFCSAIRFAWGDKDYMDVMALLDTALRSHPWIDPERLGVLGGSYGGYMTNWIVGHTDRFRAAVSMRSVVEWGTMMGTSDGGPEWTYRAGGEPPWRRDDWYRQQSPLTYVDAIVTPLLIEHQEGDLRCPIEQGEMLYTAVRWLGKAPVRFVRYPGEFHGMSRNGQPFHRVHRLRQILDWFGRYLGGERPALTPVDRTYRERAGHAAPVVADDAVVAPRGADA